MQASPPPWEQLASTDMTQHYKDLMKKGSVHHTLPSSSSNSSSSSGGGINSSSAGEFSHLLGVSSCAISSGNAHVDRLLFLSGLGCGAGGGVQSGTLTEVYGPPLGGKSRVAIQCAQAFIRKQIVNASNHCSDNGNDNWAVYACVTPSAAPQWQAALLGVVEEGRYDSNIHMITVSDPNDLLSFLKWYDERTEEAFSSHHEYKNSNDNNASSRVLITIDSLAALWHHSTLTGGNSTHCMRWFSAELRRLLRRCTALRILHHANNNSNSDGSACLIPFYQTTSIWVVNGCGYYNASYSLQNTATSVMSNPSSPITGGWRPPKPLGDDGWSRYGAQVRLFVEAASYASNAVTVPRRRAHGSSTAANNEYNGQDDNGDDGIFPHDSNEHHHFVSGGGADAAFSNIYVVRGGTTHMAGSVPREQTGLVAAEEEAH